MPAQRNAVVVRGGWDGHVPVEATDSFLPFLESNGYDVSVHDTLDVYLDTDTMAAADLIVQCWTMGEITGDQFRALSAAVRSGTGFAGWHGGIVDAFRATTEYFWLTGGQFMAHPGGQVDHEIVVTSDHEIVKGIDRIPLHSEQYWVGTDAANDVLATTTFAAGYADLGRPGPEVEEVTVPAVWTRRWAAGRIFVATMGHGLVDLDIPEVRTIIERGLVWASRRPDGGGRG